jgi:hypothetical protein
VTTRNDDVSSRKVQIAAVLTYWVVKNIDLASRYTDPRLFNFETLYDGHQSHRGESKELFLLVSERMPIGLSTHEFRMAMDLLSEGSIATVLNNGTDFPVVSIYTNCNMEKVKETIDILNRDIALMSEKYPLFCRTLGENIDTISVEIEEIVRLQKIHEMADRVDVSAAIEVDGLAVMLDRLNNAAAMGKVIVLSPHDTVNLNELINSAKEIVITSNIMPTEQNVEHLAHLESLLILIDKVKSISAGTLKYLFVDRLRSSLDGIIEDEYKSAIMYLLGVASAFAFSRI